MTRRSDEPGAALAIGLGANLPTACGSPLDTLVAVRPRLNALFERWAGPACPLCWSPLFRTAPVGGPPDQPDYINAAVLVVPPLIPSAAKALELLAGLQQLELYFGRERLEYWGPRTLDLDLLWWGELRCNTPELQLPHPRWHERGFVLAPLLAIEQRCPGLAPMQRLALPGAQLDCLPRPIVPSPPGWLL